VVDAPSRLRPSTWTRRCARDRSSLAACRPAERPPRPHRTGWWLPMLKPFRVQTVGDSRIVHEARFVTFGRVSSGIDLAMWLFGRDLRRRPRPGRWQLGIEYDPPVRRRPSGHVSKAHSVSPSDGHRAADQGRRASSTAGVLVGRCFYGTQRLQACPRGKKSCNATAEDSA